MAEARQVAAEIAEHPDVPKPQARVAILFDYDADAAWSVQPHGAGLSYFGLVFDLYRALRALGISLDIVSSQVRDFGGYDLILGPGMMHMPDDLKTALADCAAHVVIGPRSAARDADMCIPTPLPPGLPGLDVTVARVESLRPDMPMALHEGGHVQGYREVLEGRAEASLRTQAGDAVSVTNGRMTYLGAWLEENGWHGLLRPICLQKGIPTLDLPTGVRLRDTGVERFWFNFTTAPVQIAGLDLPPISVTRQDGKMGD